MRDNLSVSAAGPSVGDSAQTRRSFEDKWSKNPKLALEQTLDPASNFQKWILERNGWRILAELETGLRTRRRVLDAGCGNGRVTALMASVAPHAEILGIDQVDLAPAIENAAGYSNASFRNANLRLSLTSLGVFDFIYCQEVLHHTGNAQESFNNLVGILAPQGEIAIYVYRRKAPAREFMDDFVRGKISSLPYEEAMTVCRQITELGRQLSVIDQELKCEDIPTIGIEQGRYTPHRILYNFFLKCYWNPGLSFEENAAINYDWYHPTHCSRHTVEEVEGWFGQAGLQIIWQKQDLYGITMRGLKKSG